MQCWALALSTYEYNVLYKSGNANTNIQQASLTRNNLGCHYPLQIDIVNGNFAIITIITATQIKSWTDRKSILAWV